MTKFYEIHSKQARRLRNFCIGIAMIGFMFFVSLNGLGTIITILFK